MVFDKVQFGDEPGSVQQLPQAFGESTGIIGDLISGRLVHGGYNAKDEQRARELRAQMDQQRILQDMKAKEAERRAIDEKYAKQSAANALSMEVAKGQRELANGASAENLQTHLSGDALAQMLQGMGASRSDVSGLIGNPAGLAQEIIRTQASANGVPASMQIAISKLGPVPQAKITRPLSSTERYNPDTDVVIGNDDGAGTPIIGRVQVNPARITYDTLYNKLLQTGKQGDDIRAMKMDQLRHQRALAERKARTDYPNDPLHPENSKKLETALGDIQTAYSKGENDLVGGGDSQASDPQAAIASRVAAGMPTAMAQKVVQSRGGGVGPVGPPTSGPINIGENDFTQPQQSGTPVASAAPLPAPAAQVPPPVQQNANASIQDKIQEKVRQGMSQQEAAQAVDAELRALQGAGSASIAGPVAQGIQSTGIQAGGF